MFRAALAAVLVLGCSDDGNVVPNRADGGGEPACVNADCSCTSQSDCRAHSECPLDGAAAAACSCVTGYEMVGQFCIFAGLADPDINGDPAAWLTTVEIDSSANESGMIDDGYASWTTADISALAAIEQTLAMPTLDEAEPFVAVVHSRLDHMYANSPISIYTAAAPSAFIRLGAQWTRSPVNVPNTWETHRVCLGESAYGGDVRFAVAPGNPQANAITGYGMRVDSFQIEPAEQGECPRPGEVVNGDFEASGGWTLSPEQATAEIREGVGYAGSRAGVLEAIDAANPTTACNWRPTMSTPVSIPSDGTGKAIEITWEAGAGTSVDIGLGLAEFGSAIYWSFTKMRPIGTLTGGQGAQQISRVCVPPPMLGTVAPLTFKMDSGGYDCPDGSGTDKGRWMYLDEIKVVDAPGCPGTGAGADLSFEAVQSAVIAGWTLTRDVGRMAHTPLVGAAEAIDGNRVLRLESTPANTDCSWAISAETSLVYPPIQPGEAPAIRFSYRFSDPVSAQALLIWSRNRDYINGGRRRLPAADSMGTFLTGWRTHTICGDAGDAERPVELTLDFHPKECTTGSYVDIDNVELVAIPEGDCP